MSSSLNVGSSMMTSSVLAFALAVEPFRFFEVLFFATGGCWIPKQMSHMVLHDVNEPTPDAAPK